MATGQISKVIQHLRSTVLEHEGAEPTDGQLLDRFVKERESAALEMLVRRHAAMVWGVCRRILASHHDAEDAFQASFLVLVRKASSIKPRDMVGNWLYGVAHQTALKARATSAKRHAREKQVTAMTEPAVCAPEATDELCRVLDAELAGLPDKYRAVVVLCELEGKPLKDAAQQLGAPPGTVASRLARGRALLAKRLARHGFGVAGLAGVIAQQADGAHVPSQVLSTALEAVALTAQGDGAAVGVVSAKAAALAEGVMKTMFLAKIVKLTAVVVVAAACCALTYLGHASLAAGQSPESRQVAEQPPMPNVLAAQDDPVQPDKIDAVAQGQEKKDKEAQDGKDKEKKEDKKPRKAPFTVGKETTHVLGPLDKAGRVDYETALNEKLREGVTPENNAVVSLFKVIGPHPDDAKIPETFFPWLKTPAPPDKGDYFVNTRQFRRDHLNGKPPGAFDEAYDKATARPWTAKEHPDFAAWLKVNEKPLAAAVEASKKTHYYYPVVATRKDGKTDGLITASLAGVQSSREIAAALSARAMLRISEKRYEEARQDLLACHRLGRLVGRGGTLIEALVGIAVDRIASDGDLVLLEKANFDAKKLKVCLRDLQELPPLPVIADKVDLTERYLSLESVMLTDRDGVGYLEMVAGGHGNDDVVTKVIGKWLLTDIDWDPALTNINKLFDRMTTSMKIKERDLRATELNKINNDIRALKGSLTEAKDIARTVLGAKSMAAAKGKYAGDVLICLLVPATMKVQQAGDRAEQIQRNLHIAVALAAYKADYGRYPKTLDALAPKYLAAVPNDYFSGKALIYRPADNGYLLYSVGSNGQDENGRTNEDDPRGDDIPVRMPLPKREK